MNTGSEPERFELPGRMSAYLEDAKGMRTETLIESDLPAEQELSRLLLDDLMPYTGNALRLGITGLPG